MFSLKRAPLPLSLRIFLFFIFYTIMKSALRPFNQITRRYIHRTPFACQSESEAAAQRNFL